MAALSCGAHNGRAAPMCWFVHSGARSCGMHRLLQAFGVRTNMIGTRYGQRHCVSEGAMKGVLRSVTEEDDVGRGKSSGYRGTLLDSRVARPLQRPPGHL